MPGPGPQELREDLGPLLSIRPVILGEKEADYDQLLDDVVRLIVPKDVLERLFTKEIADCVWEAAQLRRLKTQLIMSARREALHRTLKSIRGIDGAAPFSFSFTDDSTGLVNRWASGEAQAVVEVNASLKKAGLDSNSVMAAALAATLNEVERIERMAIQHDARRSKLLQEIERRREAKTGVRRPPADDIIDIEP